jgi:hypothetical protein
VPSVAEIPHDSAVRFALSVADLDRLVQALPAETRATLAWAPGDLRAAIKALRDNRQRGPEGIATAAEAVFRLTEPVLDSIVACLGEHALSARISTLWKCELDLLRSFLPDAASVHAAEWLLAALDATFRTVGSSMDSAEWENIRTLMKGKPLPSSLFGGVGGELFRVQVLLMAAISEADDKGSPENASDLVDEAFLEMTRFEDLLARASIKLDLYPRESQEDRARRLLAYVQDVRDSLTSIDLAHVVSAGQLGPLR